MEGKNQTIFLSVIGIATLLVAIVGATFAWFSAQVEGNNEASSITVQTATLASIIFEDTNELGGEDVLPGWSDSKTFTVSRPAGTSVSQGFTVKLLYTNVAATGVTGATPITDMKYNINATYSDGAGGTTLPASLEWDALSRNVDGALGASGTKTIATGTFTLATEETYTFDFDIAFVETGLNQNVQQGASFNGLIQVEVDGGAQVFYNTWNQGGTTSQPAAVSAIAD